MHDGYGIHGDVTVSSHLCSLTYYADNDYSPPNQPFTAEFPRANIHELISPDLLHQIIKGTFKDHLVTWVVSYIESEHPGSEGKAILSELDRR